MSKPGENCTQLIDLGPVDQTPRLSMRETIACIDNQGRCRCRHCGRYSRLEDMVRVPSIWYPGTIVSIAPACIRCRADAEVIR